MATHIIVGTGEGVDVPQSVINEGLREVIQDGDSVVMQWWGRPSSALGKVYDYIFDQQIQFELVHNTGGSIPKAFTDAKFGHVINPNNGIAGEFSAMLTNDGKFVVIGEDDATNDMIIEVYEKVSTDTPGIEVLDLADGLTPVMMMEEDGDEEQEPEAVKRGLAEVKDDDPTDTAEVDDDSHATGVEEPDPLSFTREEMESMPLRTLQRLCKNAGIESPGGNSKDPYINALIEAQNDDVAREINGVQPIVWDSVEGALDYAISTLRQASVNHPDRITSITITKLEEALLWYHYGADIVNFGG